MNPLLEQTKQALSAKINPRLQPIVQKLVHAGEQVMYSEKTQHLLISQLKGAKPDGMDEVIGGGIAKLAGILFAESRKTAPMQALVPAAMLLMCDGLEFLEEAGAVKVTPQFLADCTRATGSAIAQVFGATPQALTKIAAQQGGQPGAPQPGAAPPAPPPQGIVGQAMGGA